MSAPLARWAAFLLVAAATAVGCRQLVGVDDRPAIATCGGVALSGQDCAVCVQSACCAEATACGSATGCAAFSSCVAACAPGDAACSSGCRASAAAGDGAEAATLQRCQNVRCSNACPSACGGYVFPDPACGACGAAHCCDAATACMMDSECAVLVACERACTDGDDPCLQRCELAHPGAVPLARGFGACVRDACAATCVPPRWACLKHPPPAPTVTASHLTLGYAITDYVTGRPVVGLNLQACGRRDAACVNPAKPPAKTDALYGFAQLSLATGFFDGYVEMTGAGYATALIHYPPLTHDLAGNERIAAVPSSVLTNFIGAVTPTPIAGRGNLIVRVHDCTGAAAGGVTLSLDPPDTRAYYFAGGVPSIGATATDEGGDTGGYVAFVYVPANVQLTVHATVVENGLSFPAGVVFARADAAGYSQLMMFAAPP